MGASKVSVLYIYIDNNNITPSNNWCNSKSRADLGFQAREAEVQETKKQIGIL